ncbi:MAG: heme/copper-type cytochrome/quinol oxidase, subunit 3 [Marmoricola sp.]|nr:heme/copper-type cytochrome/quinol oxidase, subunit 3 [Marmoricola sp.]
MWVLIAGDMVIFSLLFGSFMSARMKHPEVFETGRHALDFHRGGINTLLLLTSSWCVAMTLKALRTDRDRAALRWLGFGILGGVAFAVSKVLEYVAEVHSGHTPASGDFFMYYFMMTGIHLAHVIVGTLVLSVFWFRLRRPTEQRSLAGFESAAVFWHMVDLLWVVLFPLLYLVR